MSPRRWWVEHMRIPPMPTFDEFVRDPEAGLRIFRQQMLAMRNQARVLAIVAAALLGWMMVELRDALAERRSLSIGHLIFAVNVYVNATTLVRLFLAERRSQRWQEEYDAKVRAGLPRAPSVDAQQ